MLTALGLACLIPHTTVAAQSDPSDRSTQAVIAYVTAYAAKDYDTMASYLAENAVFEDPANHYEGRDAIISNMKANAHRSSDTGVPPEEILKLRSGTTYILASKIDFNLLMSPGGSPEREYNFKVNFVIMLKVEDGLIVRHDDFVDSDAFMSQLQAQMGVGGTH